MTTLKELLKNEPFPELLQHGQHADILRLLNAETVDTYRPLTSRELLMWAAGGGRLSKIKTGCGNDQLPLTIRSLCEATLILVTRDGTTLDLSLPDVQGMLAALVAAGVLTAGDSASLYALAAAKTSQAIKELGRSVTMEMLGEAIG